MTPNTTSYYVYGHYRPDSNTLFYVGKGKDKRAWSSRNRNKHWHHIVNKVGYSIFIFCKGMDESSAYDLEKAIITDLSPEANYLPGGLSVPSFAGQKHSELTKKKMSENNRGKLFRAVREEDIQRLRLMSAKKSHKILDKTTGIIYRSIRECSRSIGRSKTVVIRKIGKRFIRIYD